ncbi:MAG: amidohydrolase [Eggerthellaceae bacterium]
MQSMLFEDINTVNASGDHIAHAYVGVRDGRIDYVGKEAPSATYDSTYDGRGKLLMPGLYNAHSHVPMTLLRGMGENMPLDRWLNDAIFPFEALMTDDDSYYGTLLGIAEMLRFGVVSFTDMYYHSEARAKAIIESGTKCNLGHSVLDFDPDISYDSLPEAVKNQELIRVFQGAADGRLMVDFNLHAEYTSTRKVAEGLAQAAAEEGVRMQVHVSETAAEVEGCRERHGMTPVEYLADCGIFDVPTTAAHCVWLNDADRAILAEKGVFVATCPASNAKLGSGVAGVLAMRDAGVTVALGTDGVASNNNHNMFKDMYLLALMERAHSASPLGLSSADIICMATRNGALSQGREDCGDIAVGNRADIVVLDIDTPWMTPCEDMASSLIYSAQGSDVVLTMADGEVLYKDGEYLTIDIEKAQAEVLKSRMRIKNQL